jgi:hypothetical protein
MRDGFGKQLPPGTVPPSRIVGDASSSSRNGFSRGGAEERGGAEKFLWVEVR